MLELCLKHLPAREELFILTITVPANFANGARTKTLKAAKSAAGPRVDIRMIDEPTAVALYYASAFPQLPKGCYLVFDFGGGTLDVSVVDLDGRAVAVKSSIGEASLGGADFDLELLKMLQERFEAKAKKSLSQSASGLDFSKLEALKEELCGGRDISLKLKSQGGRAVEIKLTSKDYTFAVQPTISSMPADDQRFHVVKSNITGLSHGSLSGSFSWTAEFPLRGDVVFWILATRPTARILSLGVRLILTDGIFPEVTPDHPYSGRT